MPDLFALMKRYLPSLCCLLVSLIAGYISAAAQQSQPGEGEISVMGVTVRTIPAAFQIATDGAVIRIGPGVFRQGGVLKHDNIRIMGSPGTVIEGGPVEGKAALVIKGKDTVIEDIACRGIEVPDNNGACIRMEGQNLILRRVHFSDSQQGILAGNKPGVIRIEDSRFERLGKRGRAHGVYVNGGQLIIIRSLFLASQDQGHAIKSRATETLISNSVVASLDAPDSRLVDAANGGIVRIRSSLLIEGPNSPNRQLLSFGVEGKPHARSILEVSDCLIISDRQNHAELVLAGKDMPKPIIRRNMIVGRFMKDWGGDNLQFKSRAELGLPPKPQLPDWNPVRQ